MRALCKVEMLEESSKPSKLSGKPTIAFLPHGVLQLPTHTMSWGVGWYGEQEESFRPCHLEILKSSYSEAQPGHDNWRVETARGTNHDIWSQRHASLIVTTIVCRILVDTRSSTDMITLECLRKLPGSCQDPPVVGLGDKSCIPLEPNEYLSMWAIKTTHEL
ncbi:hypothetical protein Cgig2_003561 [Carnegiea gigantea]|uniref:Uncharacterized protein n=1 Tax=Carnegiea gigantea TaxID=171969 RepID=A0A9Q1GXI3_9CARY|nr:hypothetical protein Cgig2_003561 [Carnegiea gigantea]